jgi:hypothetical protein
MAGRVAQVVDYLLSKRQALSSISGTAKKKKKSWEVLEEFVLFLPVSEIKSLLYLTWGCLDLHSNLHLLSIIWKPTETTKKKGKIKFYASRIYLHLLDQV